MAGQPRQVEEIVERRHAQTRGPFEQDVEQVGGGQDVVEGAVARPMGEAERVGQGGKPQVGGVLTDQTPGHRHRVDRPGADGRARGGDEGGVEERHVEAQVVAHEHGPRRELGERREHGLDGGCAPQHVVGDAGERRHRRLHGRRRVDEGPERPQALAAAEPRRADLADGAGRR